TKSRPSVCTRFLSTTSIQPPIAVLRLASTLFSSVEGSNHGNAPNKGSGRNCGGGYSGQWISGLLRVCGSSAPRKGFGASADEYAGSGPSRVHHGSGRFRVHDLPQPVPRRRWEGVLEPCHR